MEGRRPYGFVILLTVAAMILAAVSMLFAWYGISGFISGIWWDYEDTYYLYGQDQEAFSEAMDAEVALILLWFALGWATCALFLYSWDKAAVTACTLTMFVAISAVLNLVVWTYAGDVGVDGFYGSSFNGANANYREWGPERGWYVAVIACALSVAATALASREYYKAKRGIAQPTAPETKADEED